MTYTGMTRHFQLFGRFLLRGPVPGNALPLLRGRYTSSHSLRRIRWAWTDLRRNYRSGRAIRFAPSPRSLRLTIYGARPRSSCGSGY